jgi:hypothetical protein
MTSNQTSESSGSQLPPKRRCCASCLLLAIVFVSGLLAGGGLTIIFDLDEEVSRIFGLAPKPRKPRSIAELRDSITDRYAVELGLSAEQKSKVREVLTKHFSGSLQRRIQLLDKLSEALYPILNDDQRANWEKLKADRIKKWSEGMPTTRPTTQPSG